MAEIEVVSTVRSTGGDYSSVSGWESGESTDLTSWVAHNHGGITGSIAVGDSVTGASSSATGTVKHITASVIVIEVATGTFTATETIYETVSVNYVVSSSIDSTSDIVCVAECYDDWPTGLLDTVTFTGWTVSSSRFTRVRAASGSEHSGILEAGFWMRKTGASVIECLIDYAQFIDIELKNTKNNGYCLYRYSGTNARLERVILQATGSTARGWNSMVANDVAINCLAVNTGSPSSGNGFLSNLAASTTAVLNNCTAADWGTYGIQGGSYGADAYNCVSVGNGTAGFDSAVGGDYNAADDTSSPGANSVDSISTTEFNDYANQDFHLASGSTSLKDAGTTRSGYSDDVDGDTRSGSWDIGFDELAATDVSFTANAGAYTLASQAAAVAADRTANANAAAYTLADQSATVTADRTVNANAGSYTITGYSASVQTGADVAFTANAGSFTLAGQSASVTADASFVVSAGAYTLADQAATATADRTVNANAGAYTLAIQAATVTADRTVNANAGAYTLEDQAAAITADRTVNANAGAYTLADQAATVTADRTVDANAGAYTLAAYGATIATAGNTVFTADAGAYTLAAQAAVVSVAAPVSLTPVIVDHVASAAANLIVAEYISNRTTSISVEETG
jgi:hypothetical protein